MPATERRDWLERMVFRGIVFNMSWEDPEMDRQAFQIQPTDAVISISSAGCNPLNLLAQNPARLVSIDGNPGQNALVELKLAGLQALDYQTFFDIFGVRHPAAVTRVYRTHLRPLISPPSQAFWDENLWMAARGIYDFGRNGTFFRILRNYLKLLGIRKRHFTELFELRSLAEQQAWYDKTIAPRLWGPWSKRFVEFKPFMFLAGVHPEQYRLVDGRHDMYEYVKERVEYALTRVRTFDNYFLSIALTGKFQGDRVPPYLLPEHFEPLRSRLARVTVVNGWLGPYLDTQPAGSIQKFNLLDIFDWMTPQIFESTMHSVIRAAAPGATMIYRSGSYKFDPPASILPHVQRDDTLAKRLFATDRSATYGSFYILRKLGGDGASTNGRHAEALSAAAT